MLRTWRLFLVRPRLILSLVLMLVSFWFIPASPSSPTRIFTAWNLGVWFYIVSLWVLMFRADATRIKKIAQKQNDSATLILALVCVAAIMSLLAVVIELPTIKQLPNDLRQVHIALTALTLVGTWLLIPTAFTMHYAHHYYVNMGAKRVLQFPEQPDEPLYSDFLYFSFTIAVASQTADVAIASYSIRQVVLVQSILSFLFNTSLIGLTINIASGLIG